MGNLLRLNQFNDAVAVNIGSTSVSYDTSGTCAARSCGGAFAVAENWDAIAKLNYTQNLWGDNSREPKSLTCRLNANL